MSYIMPFLFLVAGIILMSVYGLKPFEEWYAKNYRWIAVPATFERGKIISVDGPKSLVAKDTGSRFKIKFTLKFEPRKLFDAAYFDERFPAWLRLPNQSFLWSETRETYDSILEARKAFDEMKARKSYKIYMNPENPRNAVFETWSNWLIIQLGFTLAALGLLGFGFIFIVNTRRVMIAEKQHQEELWRQQNMRRHHNKAAPNPPE
ncbi:hypothetical protein KKF84_14885 [Myxococcota bacterium]|nr:hypothetical protein [Myxococcota bacterium]